MNNFHFSSMGIRAVHVLYYFLYPHEWEGKCLLIYSKICFCIIISQILDTTGRTLTGIQFFNNETYPFLNTGVTSASLRLVGKLFCVIISLFQMSFNAGTQILDQTLFLKALLGYYQSYNFFLLFKAVVSLSIYH